MSDYDDDRPNWREIDRKKEKSTFYGRHEKKDRSEEGTREGSKDRWQAGRVQEAIERIFQGKKGTIEHDKAFRKLHQSYGSTRFLKNAGGYIEQYGLPDDAATLLLMLDARDAKDQTIMLSAIEKLRDIYGTLQQRQKDDVMRKFSIIAMSDRSKEVRSKVEAIMEELA